MYNFNIGKYYNIYSEVHNMNSTYKLLCLLLFTFLLLIIDNIIFISVISLLTIILMLLSNVPLKLYFNNIKPIIIFILFIFIVNIIFKAPLIDSLMVVLKLILMVMYSSIFMFTTTNYDITRGLDSILKPLKVFKINTSLISQSIALSINFIPVIFATAEKVLKSQASRGLDFNNGNLKNKIKSITSVIFPMFMLSFKRADSIADFMEVRLYNIEGNYNIEKEHNLFDTLILIVHIFLFIVYLYRSVIL